MEQENRGLMNMLANILNIVKLNLCFLVCSLPIITIGASLTALYSVHMKLIREEEAYIVKDFFKAFRQGFRQSTICWLVTIVIGAALFADREYYGQHSDWIGIFFQLFLWLYTAFVLLLSLYLYPYISRYRDNLKNCVKKSLLISLANLKYTLAMLGWGLLCAGLTITSEAALKAGSTLWLTCGFSLLAYTFSFFIRKIFEKMEVII